MFPVRKDTDLVSGLGKIYLEKLHSIRIRCRLRGKWLKMESVGLLITEKKGLLLF